MLSLLKIDVAW